MTINRNEDFDKMSNLCPFSRQIEIYCEMDGKKNPPEFLTEHYETCDECRPQFLKLGKELEVMEALIPKVVKEDIKENQDNIFKTWIQHTKKSKKRGFFF